MGETFYSTLFYYMMPGEPALVTWWQGVGAVINVTHPPAVAWFERRLRRLMHLYGIDGFKFDAGEDIYVPAGSENRID